MKVGRLKLIAMPVIFCLNMLCGCGAPGQSAQHGSQSQLSESPQAGLESSAVPQKPNYKIDFTNGASPLQSFGDMQPKDIILNTLREHRDKIDLEQAAPFMSKISRDDLLALQNPEAKLVTTILFPAKDLTDFDIEPLSALKLNTLTMAGNKFIDLHPLSKMQTLSVLDVSGSPLSDSGINVISGLYKLHSLTLCDTPITDQNLASFRHLDLGGLDLTGCTKISKEAVQQFKKEHPKCKVTYGPKPTMYTAKAESTLHQVERELFGQHEYDEADLTLAKLIADCEKQNPPPWSILGQAYIDRAECQVKTNNLEKARSALEAALVIYKSHLPDDPRFPVAKSNLADILERIGLPDDALIQRKEAETIWQRFPAIGDDMLPYSTNQKKLKMRKRL